MSEKTLTFTETELAAALGDVRALHDMSVELIAECVFSQLAQQQGVPEGFTIAPATANAEMIAAAEDVEDLYRRGTPDTWAKVYRAMLAAAHAPVVEPASPWVADTEAAIQLAFELGGLEDGSYHLEADELERVLRAALPPAPEVGK